jgi:tetratricopeptide (TPR) repeat protein
MTMPSTRLFESLELNNDGARMICKGEYGRAISTFSKALGILQELLAAENNCSSLPDAATGSDSSACSYYASSMGESISFIGAESSNVIEEGMSDHEDDESSHFVFQRPIVMALDFELCGSRTPAKLTAIMIFNFALSHHLSAMKHNTNCSQLHIALRLYENAYLIQQNEQVEICALYDLALWNNLGQVLNATEHISKARQCFEKLLCSLLFLLEYCDDDEKRNLQCFLRSASSCILGNANIAAPAA